MVDIDERDVLSEEPALRVLLQHYVELWLADREAWRDRVVDDAKVSDHHANIPTDDVHDLSRLSSDERRIYDLVAKRFLAVFHPPARFEQTTVTTIAGGESFRSQGKVLIDAGWRAVYGETGI